MTFREFLALEDAGPLDSRTVWQWPDGNNSNTMPDDVNSKYTQKDKKRNPREDHHRQDRSIKKTPEDIMGLPSNGSPVKNDVIDKRLGGS